MLSDAKNLADAQNNVLADAVPDAVAKQAYERRIQRLEQERADLQRKFNGTPTKLRLAILDNNRH